MMRPATSVGHSIRELVKVVGGTDRVEDGSSAYPVVSEYGGKLVMLEKP